MKKLLISLSGARPEVLEKCPTERIRFQSLGWAILITSGMATVSMWFALNSVLGLNVVVAFFGALLWGAVIMGIDRWLITSLPLGPRRWGMAVPRLVLAILLGTLISTPIVLRVFQSEINAQIAVIKADRASNFLQQQRSSQVNAQVASWTRQVSSLENVITSGGEVALNPAADPEVKSLTTQKKQEVTLQQTYLTEWQCQLYGGPSCPSKGPGPVAQADHQNYLAATAQVNATTARITARENELQASDAQSRSARLQEAKSALPAAKEQLALATARKDKLQAAFDATNENTNGLLIRLQALNQLTNQGFTLSAARFLLFLLFLVIECLPVTVKLLQQPGNYERILAEAQEKEIREARRGYRPPPRRSTQPGSSTLLNLDPPTVPADAQALRDARDAGIREIWKPGSDMPTWAGISAGQRAQAPAPQPATETGEQRRLDELAIRAIDDSRPDAARGGADGYADPARNGTGIELRYSDDDL